MVVVQHQLKRSKKSYWDNPKLKQFIRDKIRGGLLIRGQRNSADYDLDKALASLVRSVNAEFEKEFAEEGHRFTKTSLKIKISELIFDEVVGKLLGEYVAMGWDLGKFYEDHSYIPKVLVDRKAKQLRGKGGEKSPPPSLRGVLRLVPDGADVKHIDMPVTSVENPILIPSEGLTGLYFINAPQLGLPYDGRMAKNPLRCAMELAERDRKAVIITGGLMHLRLKIAHGTMANYEARTSAMDIDYEVIDPSYREGIREWEVDDGTAMIYTTLLENFENLRSALRNKIFRHSKESGGKPRFTVPVYFQLGQAEEELIAVGTQHHIRVETLRRRAQVSAKIAEAKARRKAEWTEERENDVNRYIEELARTTMTNVHAEIGQKVNDMVRSFVVERIMDAIPGVVILGSGQSFIKYDGEIGEIKHVGGDNVSLSLTDAYIQSQGNHQTKMGTPADFVVLCNRYNPHAGGTFIDNTRYHSGKSVPVILLPVAIDGAHIKGKFRARSLLGNQTRIQRLVNHSLFTPGILAMHRASKNWVYDLYTIPAVQHLGGPLKKDETWAKRQGTGKYWNELSFSDLHSGHPWEKHIWNHERKELMDLTSSFVHMLRTGNGFGRIHGFKVEDDLVQGANFANHLQKHENALSFGKFQAYVKRMQARIASSYRRGNTLGAHALEEEFARVLLKQRIFKGEYRGQDQFKKLIDGYLKPNTDFFADIILTHRKADANYVGVSRMKGELSDDRDLSAITFGNGNHWKHTGLRGENHISEGFVVGEILENRLTYYPGTMSLRGDFTGLIGAPQHGVDLIGLAVLETKRGAKYGLHVRGTPARKGPANGFPLEPAAKNAIARGNHTDCFHGVELEVQMTGDIHKGGFVLVPGYLHVSCPAATRGDPYGSLGFSRSHIGGVNIALPEEGTGRAPARITFFMGDWIEEWHRESFPVDFTGLLPDPV